MGPEPDLPVETGGRTPRSARCTRSPASWTSPSTSCSSTSAGRRRPSAAGAGRGPSARWRPAPRCSERRTGTASASRPGCSGSASTTMSEPGIEFLHVTYEVGGASSPEDAYQRHAGHEWGYVLTGSLQVRIGFEEFVLGPVTRSRSTRRSRTASRTSATSR